jgi:hypothetical protein
MKKWIFTALAVSALVLPAAAFAGKDHKYLTFGTGKVLQDKNSTQASITNDVGEYGGLYATKAAPSAKLTQVVFTFKTDGDVQAGALRWSIPIDVTGDGRWDDYASLDAANCGATAGTNDAKVITVVSTDNPNCKVFLNSKPTMVWANWAAFAAENPAYRVAKKDIPFIITDAAGDYHVYGFQFG